jgi:hypothetical protein
MLGSKQNFRARSTRTRVPRSGTAVEAPAFRPGIIGTIERRGFSPGRHLYRRTTSIVPWTQNESGSSPYARMLESAATTRFRPLCFAAYMA